MAAHLSCYAGTMTVAIVQNVDVASRIASQHDFKPEDVRLMIRIDEVATDREIAITIRLSDNSDVEQLNSVFLTLSSGEATQVDLARQEGVACSGIDALILSNTTAMRHERVTVAADGKVYWTKTSEGWTEASELLLGLQLPSHQYLGSGD